QASASVLGEHGPGCTAGEIEAVGDQVAAMLKSSEPPAESELGEFRPFLPVRSHKSRYECVLLPFKAIGRAFSEH
ncbi:MAG: iron-sulfur cluster assembly scaffold protein, partial [Geminicoccaceae bacterium]|nr:iron-sulfur cluster assembly scaffold protein [Geminicoccaceae bacterium]